MAYRFRKKDRSVEFALRRIAREQVDRALRTIANDEPAAAIHEVRQRCKKLRALIRLVGPSFEGFTDENADFRDIARLLGGAREATVFEETLDRLAVRHGGIDARALRDARDALRTRHSVEYPAAGLGRARDRLIAARARIAGWTLAAGGWAAIGPGLMQTTIRARRALERIGGSHAADRFHDLRKQVKYHGHHMRLLRPTARGEIRTRRDLASALGDRLGEHHDLAVLGAMLRADSGAIAALADEERFLLEAPCLVQARELLAESAESVTERFGRKWSAWRHRRRR